MAGLDLGGGTSARRALDSDINMIPMIDLLMVTISFLLITAVWVHSQRMDATANAPGRTTDPCEGACKEEARLHVETSDPTKFVLAWKIGRTVVSTVEVPRGEKDTRFPELARKVVEEWRTAGHHREAADKQFDHAVVHAANDMPYQELIAVMDAVAAPKRSFAAGPQTVETTAFDVTFAAD